MGKTTRLVFIDGRAAAFDFALSASDAYWAEVVRVARARAEEVRAAAAAGSARTEAARVAGAAGRSLVLGEDNPARVAATDFDFAVAGEDAAAFEIAVAGEDAATVNTNGTFIPIF